MRKLGENGTFYAGLEEKKMDLKGQRLGKNINKKTWRQPWGRATETYRNII